MNLTLEEKSFISRNGIDISEIYDATNFSSNIWKENCKRLGFYFVVGGRCRKFGHRLRTRANHCIQCNTAAIAFMKRHFQQGVVYIATSPTAGVIKVGSTNHLAKRITTLRNQAYGGVSDWSISFGYKTDGAGEFESRIQNALKEFLSPREYVRSDHVQVAKEIFNCDKKHALEIILSMINNKKIERFSWFQDIDVRNIVQKHCNVQGGSIVIGGTNE